MSAALHTDVTPDGARDGEVVDAEKSNGPDTSHQTAPQLMRSSSKKVIEFYNTQNELLKVRPASSALVGSHRGLPLGRVGTAASPSLTAVPGVYDRHCRFL